MKHRDAHALAQFALDDEALRRLDVFKVDAAKGGLKAGDDLDQLVGILFVDLDIEDIDAGKLLEQNRLALHHRLGSQRPDIAQPEDGGAICDHPDEVTAGGVTEGVRRIADDLLAGGGHTRRVGQRQVALVRQRLGGGDRNLSRASLLVIFECCLAEVFFHDVKTPSD